MRLNNEPRRDYKCSKCGKGESKHNAMDKTCPIGSGQHPQFHRAQFFEASQKLTVKSSRDLKAYEERLKQEADRKAAFEAEKNKVRAMTYEEVVTATVELLTEMTNLGVVVEREYEHSCHIHLTTLGGGIRLGYTSVTKYSDGRYGVGGTSAGCFMSNHSDDCIGNVMRSYFKAIEEKANKEKA